MALSPEASNKKDNCFFVFYRIMESSFADDELFLMKEKMLTSNCSKLYIIFPGEFPENALKWAENRDVVLVDKEGLLKIMEVISI